MTTAAPTPLVAGVEPAAVPGLDDLEAAGFCVHQDWRSNYQDPRIAALQPRLLLSRDGQDRILHAAHCLERPVLCAGVDVTEVSTAQFLLWHGDSSSSRLRPCPDATADVRAFLLVIEGVRLTESLNLFGTTLDAHQHLPTLAEVGALPGATWQSVTAAVLHRLADLAPHAGPEAQGVLDDLDRLVREHLAQVRADGFFAVVSDDDDPHWVAERFDWLFKQSNGWAGDWERAGMLLGITLHSTYGPQERRWLVWKVSATSAAVLAKDSAAHDLGPVREVPEEALAVTFAAAQDAEWDEVPQLARAARAAVAAG